MFEVAVQNVPPSMLYPYDPDPPEALIAIAPSMPAKQLDCVRVADPASGEGWVTTAEAVVEQLVASETVTV